MEHFYLQVPVAAAADTVPANLHDRITITTTITTRSLRRSDVISLNTASEILSTGSNVLMVSLFYVHQNFRTRSFLPDTDGRHKVGPQEVAVDPEEEEAEAESMQEVNRETGTFSPLSLTVNLSLISAFPRILRSTFGINSGKIYLFFFNGAKI